MFCSITLFLSHLHKPSRTRSLSPAPSDPLTYQCCLEKSHIFLKAPPWSLTNLSPGVNSDWKIDLLLWCARRAAEPLVHISCCLYGHDAPPAALSILTTTQIWTHICMVVKREREPSTKNVQHLKHSQLFSFLTDGYHLWAPFFLTYCHFIYSFIYFQ